MFDNHRMIHACTCTCLHSSVISNPNIIAQNFPCIKLKLKWILLFIVLQVCSKQVFFDIIRWSGWVGLLLWRTSQCILPVTRNITRPRCHHIWYVLITSTSLFKICWCWLILLAPCIFPTNLIYIFNSHSYQYQINLTRRNLKQ